MDINLTTENLKKLCRICLCDGELNIYEHKLSVSKLRTHDNENEREQQEELSVIKMLEKLSNGQNLQLSEELQLICRDCLKELENVYLYFIKIQNANNHIKRLFDEATKIESEASDEWQAEYLQNIESTTFEQEDVLKVDINADCEDMEEFITIEKQPTEPSIDSNRRGCKRKMIRSPTFVLTGGVTHMLSHFTEDSPNDEVLDENKCQTATAISQKHYKITRKSSSGMSSLDNASLVVAQFVPSGSEILYKGREAEHELRTVDFAAIEIKSSNINEQILNLMPQDNDASNNDTNDVYVCKYCPQAFANMEYLITHVRISHVCKYCTQAFVKKTDLFAHIRKCHSQHKCPICSKSLSSNSNLKVHVRKVHNINLPAHVTLIDYRP